MDMDVPVEQGLTALQADELLWRRLVQNDQAAYQELWHRFGPGLRRYAAARLGGDQELAEEVAVQSLAAAVRSIGRFDPRRAPFAAWLYGIARRVLVAEMRRQRRRTVVPRPAEVSLDEARDVVADGNQASDLAAHLEAQRKVRLLAHHLSNTEMEALLLHFVEEFSVKEIAHIVGRSERAVHSLLHRAKEKARERLAQDAAQ